MGRAIVFRTDFTEEELDHRPSLAEAQKIVGGYIQLVKLAHKKTLVVDEEGKLKHKLVNKTITDMYSSQIYGGTIVGDVIVLEGWRTVGY